MIRAAVYVRVSARAQEEGASLSTQEAACRRYAVEHGYTVLEDHVYRETFTGVELWERPQLTRLRDAIHHRRLDAVVAYAIDRLSRDPVHLGVILSEADHRDVTVAFVTETIDDSPEGELVRFVRGYAAKVEHEKIRERTTRGKMARAASGKLLPSGRPLYGYAFRDDEKTAYDLHPVHSLVVRRIFLEYVDGVPLRQIARALSADAIPTPTGLPGWHPDVIRRILRHPSYAGRAFAWAWHRVPGRRMEFDPTTAIPLPEGAIPAVVPPAVWDLAQERLESNRDYAPRHQRAPEDAVLLRGQVYCAHCRQRMYVERYAYRPRGVPAGAPVTPVYDYACRVKRPDGSGCRMACIRAHQVDAAAWQVVLNIITRPDWIARELDRLRADDPTERDLAAVDAALGDIARQRANLTRVAALLDDPDDAGPLAVQLAQLGERHRQLATERDTLLERQRGWDEAGRILNDLSLWGRNVAANAADLGFEDKRALVELLDVRARVYRKGSPERYVITTRFTPADLGELGPDFRVPSPTTRGLRRQPEISLRFSDRDLAAAD